MMQLILKLIISLAAGVFSVCLQAHEGHAHVGSLAHELEHAGWLAGAFMIGLVLIVLVFRMSAGPADGDRSGINSKSAKKRHH